MNARTAHKALILLLLVGLGAGAVSGTASAQDDWDDWDEEEAPPVEIHGFVEGLVGGRVVEDKTADSDLLANEARFRLDLAHYGDRADVLFKGDFLADGKTDETVIDIRQALLVAPPPGGWTCASGARYSPGVRVTWSSSTIFFPRTGSRFLSAATTNTSRHRRPASS
jgi:hypothetical protein